MAGRLPTNIEECTLGKADSLNIFCKQLSFPIIYLNENATQGKYALQKGNRAIRSIWCCKKCLCLRLSYGMLSTRLIAELFCKIKLCLICFCRAAQRSTYHSWNLPISSLPLLLFVCLIFICWSSCISSCCQDKLSHGGLSPYLEAMPCTVSKSDILMRFNFNATHCTEDSASLMQNTA